MSCIYFSTLSCSCQGLEFYGRKIIIEEAKTPPKTLVKELSTSPLANDYQSMHKISPTFDDVRSRLLKTPTEEQCPIQYIKSTFSKAAITKKKNIALFFGEYTARDKNETSRFSGED